MYPPPPNGPNPYPSYQPLPPRRDNSRVVMGLVVGAILIGVCIVVGMTTFAAFRGYSQQGQFAQGGSDYNKASKLYQDGKYEAAAQIFKKIRLDNNATGDILSKSTSGEVFCYRQLGHQAQTNNLWEVAEQWYGAALMVSPGDAQARTELENARKYRAALGAASATPAPTPPPATEPQTTQNFPKAPAPGTPNINAADFNNSNGRAAASAMQYYQKGEQARANGDTLNALRYYSSAVTAGPGSPGAQAAQQRITEYNRAHNPLDYSGG